MRNRLITGLLLLFILCCALWLRMGGLLTSAPNPDELMHLSIARGENIGEVWDRGLYETHPPLGHMLRHLTLHITDGGMGERLISLMFGLLTVALWFQIGKHVGGISGAITLAGIATLSPILINTAQEMRNYALFMLLASAAFHAYLRYDSHPRTRTLIPYAGLLLLACATHFTGFLLGAILGLDAAWKHRKTPRMLLPLILATLPTFLIGIAFYILFFADGTLAGGWHTYYVSIGKHYTPHAGEWLRHALMLQDMIGIGPWADTVLGGPTPYGLMAGATTFTLILLALIRNHEERPVILRLFLLFWGVAGAASLLQLYPLTESRHASYALLPLALPLATFFPDNRRVHALLLACLLALTAAWGLTAKETRRTDPLALTTKQLDLFQYAWDDFASPDTPVIVNRFTSLYLDHSEDGNQYFYNSTTPRLRHVGNGIYATDATLYHWSYDPARLAQVLEKVEKKYPRARDFTFFSLKRFDWDLEPFHACLKDAGAIEKGGAETKSFILYSVRRNSPVLTRCIDTVRERP